MKQLGIVESRPAKEFIAQGRPKFGDVISTRARDDGSKYLVCPKRGIAITLAVGDRFRILAPIKFRERFGFKKGPAIGVLKLKEESFIFCVVSIRGEKITDLPIKDLSRRIQLKPLDIQASG